MLLPLAIIVRVSINSSYAVSTEDGEVIFNLVKEGLEQSFTLGLDFSGITVMTTAFLSASIGQLSTIFPPEILNGKLVILGLDENKLALIQKVKSIAKKHADDTIKFTNLANEVIYGI